MDDFHLLSFETVDEFKNKIHIDFIDINKNYKGLLTTLMIGANGTRKSSILALITDVFRELDDLKRRQKKYNFKNVFQLSYRLGEREFFINNTEERIYFYKNQKKIEIEQLELPQRVIAVSFMVNDKFTFRADNEKFTINSIDQSNDEELYRYLGVRQASNITFVNTIVRKIVNLVIYNSTDSNFLKKLQIIISFLNIDNNIEICFEPKRKKNLFTRGITNKDIEVLTNKISSEVSYRSDRIKNFTKDDILNISNFINTISHNRSKVETKNGVSLCYKLNLDNPEENLTLIKDYTTLQKLLSLNYLHYPTLRFRRGNTIFDFEATSSGEKHFLFTMLSIAAEIKKSSLIIMDEPELSLHPNWQIQYISCLKNIFEDYSSCHVIIATHSHFMLSDLQAQSSSIVSLTRKEDFKVQANLHDENTFGWSVEDILYNIFGVVTTRNLFVAKELDSVLENMSKGQELTEKEIEKIIYIKSNMKENDPLAGVIEMIISRYKNDSNI